MERNFEVGKIIAVTLLAASLFVAGAQSQEDAKKAEPGKTATAAKAATAAKTAKGPEAFIGTPDKIKWVQYSPGVEFGPVYGNCDKAGAPCVFQLRFADGGKFPAHWHPVDENVTVLSGDVHGRNGRQLRRIENDVAGGGNVRVHAATHASLRGQQEWSGGAGSRCWPVQNKLCESGGRSEQGRKKHQVNFREKKYSTKARAK